MNTTLKALLVAAGIAVAGQAFALQTSPAETAGMCAGNAMLINKAATAAGPQYANVAAMAMAQFKRDYGTYGNQPGFTEAAKYAINQNSTMQQRITMADNCQARGF